MPAEKLGDHSSQCTQGFKTQKHEDKYTNNTPFIISFTFKVFSKTKNFSTISDFL